MNKPLPLSLAAAAALALLVGAAQAATPLSASMSVGAYAEVSGTVVTDTSTDAWGTPLSSLAIGAMALAVDPADASRTVLSQGFGNAGWISADAGSVSFEGYGWEINASGASSATATLTNALSDWTYSFVAGASDAQISVAYNVFGSGDTFGLWGWSIIVDGGPQGSQALYVSNPNDPTANGVFVAALTPGETYMVQLRNNANLGNGQQGFSASGQMSGNFSWQITAVPEPGTYGMLGLGLVAVAAVARRRQTRRG